MTMSNLLRAARAIVQANGTPEQLLVLIEEHESARKRRAADKKRRQRLSPNVPSCPRDKGGQRGTKGDMSPGHGLEHCSRAEPPLDGPPPKPPSPIIPSNPSSGTVSTVDSENVVAHTSASGPAPEGAPDPKRWIFDEGADLIRREARLPLVRAAPLIGKWLRDLGNDAGKLMEFLIIAEGSNPQNFVQFVSGMVRRELLSRAERAKAEQQAEDSILAAIAGWEVQKQEVDRVRAEGGSPEVNRAKKPRPVTQYVDDELTKAMGF